MIFAATLVSIPPVPQASGLHCNVLVLNRYFMPIRIVGVRRAFAMMFRKLAEAIHLEEGQYTGYDFESWVEISELRKHFEPHEHDWVRTVRFDIAVPRIVRLTLYDRLPKQEVKFNRRNIFARDANRCQYCGKKYPIAELSLDHVIPRRRSGASNWENVVACCLKCNVRKGGGTPAEAHMQLITPPTKPKRSPAISVKLSDHRYRSWKHFLDHAYWNVELK